MKVSFHSLSLHVSFAVEMYPTVRHSKEHDKLPRLCPHWIAFMSEYTVESPCGEQMFSSSDAVSIEVNISRI